MSYRRTVRVRSRILGGAFAALAVVGGAVAVTSGQDSPAELRLTQNTVDPQASTLTVGKQVSLDLKPVVAKAAGGAVPPGTTVQVTGLPDGLTQDGWVISGAPTRPGTYVVQITVSALGATESKTVQLTVVESGAATAGDQAAAAAPTTTASVTPETTTAQSTTAETAGGESTTNRPGDAATSPAESTTTTGPEATGVDSTPVTTTPAAGVDLCSALGGGQVDGAALALSVAPMLGTDEAGPIVSGVVGMLAQLLPTLLGGDTGSLGTLACAVAPAAPAAGAEVSTVPTTDNPSTGTAPGGVDPSALLGLLGMGAGSLGGH